MKRSLIECDAVCVQLENIISVASRYGDDVSFYEKELKKWNDKRSSILLRYNIHKECENCGGQGVDPNDDGACTFLCALCGGSCVVEEE